MALKMWQCLILRKFIDFIKKLGANYTLDYIKKK